MAPRYAPSLRSRLAPLLLFLQLGFIIIYALYIEVDTSLGGITFNNFYPGECKGVGQMQLLGKKQLNGCYFLLISIFGVRFILRYVLKVELWGGATVYPCGHR